MKTFIMKFVIFALFVAGAYGCGQPAFPPSTSRVVGGQDALAHSWPWQVSLEYDVDGIGDWFHTCGAALINEEWAVTAAHCINKKYAYRVSLGKHSMIYDNEAGSEVVDVWKIYVHPKYNAMKGIHDIALVKLWIPATFSDTIKPVCLPKAGKVLPHDTPCYVTGWGRLSTNGDGSDTLQQALLPVVDHATCTQDDWWSFMVTKNMLCAGGDGVKGSCFGDSGGPLSCQNADGSWEVHGVVSFGSGQGCNALKKPSVFTRISAYRSWIDDVMGL